MIINCLILDDEPIARDVIQSHISQIPELNLVKSCSNAAEAFSALAKNSVDLIFLDVQMPGISGLEFLRALDNPPLTVFTTAYSMYAVEGFELNSVDYLLKPITFERFYQSFLKVKDRVHQRKTAGSAVPVDFLFIKQDYKLFRVNYSEIDYIQAEGDYCSVFTGQKRFLVSQALKAFEMQLPQPPFIRIHRSYIVSLEKVKAIKGNTLEIGEAVLPIGSNYKEALLRNINIF